MANTRKISPRIDTDMAVLIYGLKNYDNLNVGEITEEAFELYVGTRFEEGSDEIEDFLDDNSENIPDRFDGEQEEFPEDYLRELVSSYETDSDQGLSHMPELTESISEGFFTLCENGDLGMAINMLDNSFDKDDPAYELGWSIVETYR